MNLVDSVIIDSEDTDVYVQAAYVSLQGEGELFMKHKSSLYNCSQTLDEDTAKVIIPLQILTGCEYISGFYGHGKKAILDKVQKMQRCGICYEKLVPLHSSQKRY